MNIEFQPCLNCGNMIYLVPVDGGEYRIDSYVIRKKGEPKREMHLCSLPCAKEMVKMLVEG